jgi:superfamily II DNA helicase RecQ
MALQLRFFVVPITGIEETEAEINAFLRSVRIVNTQREFVNQGNNSFWSLCVEYLANGAQGADKRGSTGKKARIDYKEVLSPRAFAVFAQLREWRKRTAAAEAVPVYTIFTNEQLALMVEKGIATRSGLQQIDGIGEARVNKYGDQVLKIITEQIQGAEHEAGRGAIPADTHL